MQAALTLLDGPSHDRLFEEIFFDRQIKLQYPPTSLLMLDLLDRIGAGSARVLNALNLIAVVVNAVCIGALADRLLLRPCSLSGRRRLALALVAAISSLLFYPVLRGLQLGQIQIWLDLYFTVACLFMVKGHEASAGAIMGLAATIKPQFLPLILVAALTRRWRFVGGFAVLALVLGVISVARYGLHNHLAYLDVLRFIAQHGESFFANNSVNGIANRLARNGDNLGWQAHSFAPFNLIVYLVTTVAGLGFIVVPFLLRPRVDEPQGRVLHFCLSAMCFVLASPVVWEHHYGVLPPIFIVAAAGLMDEQSAHRGLLQAGLLAAAWPLSALKLDTVVNKLSDTWLNPLQSTHLLGAVLLLAVLVLQISRRREITLVSAPPTRSEAETRPAGGLRL